MTNKTEMPPRSNNLQYIVAVVLMLLMAIIAIILITTFRAELDFLVVVAAVSGVVMPTTLSLLAFMKSEQTHLSVNSRLSDFMEKAEKASREEGNREGRESANERTDFLAAQAQLPPMPSVPIEVAPLEITIKEPEIK